MLFHTHYFKPSEKDPEILYCHCGQTKDIHRHIWEEIANLVRADKIKGTVLKCKICGDLKKSLYIILKI